MHKDSGSTGSWAYLDFELEVREGGPREYPLSIRSPAGEAQQEMRFPFDEWELKDKLRDLEVALLRSGGTRRGLGTAEDRTVQDFGRALFEALFADEIRVRYEASLHEAKQQGKGLRLKLHIIPPELSALPWEFIYEPDGDYLVLSSTTPLVRYLELPQRVEQLAVSPPLRILGMVASPQGLPPLDVEHEKRLMEEAVKRLRAEGLVELQWLEGHTWRDLQRAMRSGPWHIFHFVGHGGFDPATEEGAIALSDEEGRKDLLRAKALARLLDDHFPLRLVFLDSCEGAKGSERDAFSSIAATLVRYGVPAVVAMQYEITDKAAIEFSRNFYEAVADGLPVDTAVTEARAVISTDSALEWGTSVLYMRSPDGRIFDISTPVPRDQPTPETQYQKRDDSLRRYRESVESTWMAGELDARQVERLRDLADALALNQSATADIEREVIGDTIEATLERHEQTAREKERRNDLHELYARARELQRDQEWQAVVDIFAQIHAEDPEFPDLEGLLASAREALEVRQDMLDEAPAEEYTRLERREQLERERRGQKPRLRAWLRERLRPRAAITIPQPITDEVHFTVVAPAQLLPEQQVPLDVYVHTEADVDAIIQRASREYGQSIEPRWIGTGPFDRYRRMAVRISVPSLDFKDEDLIYWTGMLGNASFVLQVPATAAEGSHAGTVDVSVDGVGVARLRFVLEVGKARGEDVNVISAINLVRTAFASYASEDRERVVGRIQGMQKVLPDLDVFLDVVSLRSGEHWKERLQEEILARDIFYLFWSGAAIKSRWVDFEWRFALGARGENFISPVPLSPPDVAPPPTELTSMHFRDWTLFLSDRSTPME